MCGSLERRYAFIQGVAFVSAFTNRNESDRTNLAVCQVPFCCFLCDFLNLMTLPHWGTIFTSTPAEPMFAANFCPTGTEVDCSALPRHWRGSRYLSPVETDSHFGPTGSDVGATAEIMSRWDIISGPVARSSKWCPAGTPFSAHLILTLKCQHRRNFCAIGTQVKMRARWTRINESPPATHFPQQKNSIQGFLAAGSQICGSAVSLPCFPLCSD